VNPEPGTALQRSRVKLLNNVQALRFYAAFAVVLFHSRKLFTALGLEGDWFLAAARYGNAGVDVFFVISGYVMWHTTCAGPRTPAGSLEFARRRLFRIYLGYWPFYFLAAVVVLLISQRDPAKLHWISSFFLLNPTIFHQVLGVAWTLSFELYFYAIFAILLLFPLARARQALVLVPAGVLAYNLLLPADAREIRFFLSPFLIEFFAGSLLAAYLGQNRSRWVLLGCMVLALAAVAWAVTLPKSVMYRVQGFGLAATLIVLASVVAENLRLYVASRSWVFLGNCSYSIYLGHFPLREVYLYAIGQSQLEPGIALGLTVFFSYLALVILLSIASYRFVEAPLYKYALKNWRFPRKAS
jgi:peptidoglycan/LPS O-acetylase OafA/YrhL